MFNEQTDLIDKLTKIDAMLGQSFSIGMDLFNEQANLQARLAELDEVLGPDFSVPLPPSFATTTTPGRRTFSPATKAKWRANFRGNFKARWARLRSVASSASASRKQKRKLTDGDRAGIIAAAKAQWAKVNALKAKPSK